MLAKTLTLAALASAASARIVGLAAPKQVVANETFTVTLITENYIQSVKDLVAAFAISPRSDLGFIGTDYLGSYYLGPSKSNILTNITIEVTAPAQRSGSAFLSGVVTSLYGVSNGATTIKWTVPITYGDSVSTDQNADFSFNNVCSTATATATGTTPTIAPPTPTPTNPGGQSTSCFPSATQNLIQSAQDRASLLLNAIVQNDANAGRQARGELNGFLGDVSAATGGGRNAENCNNPPAPSWPPLSPADSQVRAIQIVQQARQGLQVLSGDVLQCDAVGAKNVVCQVLALVDNLDSYPPFA